MPECIAPVRRSWVCNLEVPSFSLLPELPNNVDPSCRQSWSKCDRPHAKSTSSSALFGAIPKRSGNVGLVRVSKHDNLECVIVDTLIGTCGTCRGVVGSEMGRQ